jgi:hypothetical protein
MIRLFSLLLLVAHCTACTAWRGESRVIADVTQPETLLFRASNSGVYAVAINVLGSIEGSAEIQLMLNGAVYRRKTIAGKFEEELSGDWYSQEAEVRYLPANVTSGKVDVMARFRTH